jgi:hypothetical protein
MAKINLDNIIDKYPVFAAFSKHGPMRNYLKAMMKDAIHEAFVLSSENAKLITTPDPHPKGWPYLMVNQKPNVDPNDRYFIVDKQSILDVEKLIV